MIESRLLSVHIEKTAGTSIQDLLETILGKDRVLIYNPIADTLTRACDLRVQRTNTVHDILRLRVANTALAPIINYAYRWLTTSVLKPKTVPISNLPNNFSAIHGNFAANRFDSQIAHSLLAVVFRDPLERMESQFIHWQRTKGIAEWRVRVPYDSTLEFEHYALLPQLQNFQSQALGGKDLDAFAIVGITKNLDTFSLELIRALEQNRLARHSSSEYHVKRLNVTPQRQQGENHGASFLKQFREFHEQDYLLYERAKKRVNI